MNRRSFLSELVLSSGIIVVTPSIVTFGLGLKLPNRRKQMSFSPEWKDWTLSFTPSGVTMLEKNCDEIIWKTLVNIDLNNLPELPTEQSLNKLGGVFTEWP